MTKPIFKMKNKMGGIILLDFKTYTATEIKAVWNCQEDRDMDQWNRREDPESAPQSTKGTEAVPQRKHRLQLRMLEQVDITATDSQPKAHTLRKD